VYCCPGALLYMCTVIHVYYCPGALLYMCTVIIHISAEAKFYQCVSQSPYSSDCYFVYHQIVCYFVYHQIVCYFVYHQIVCYFVYHQIVCYFVCHQIVCYFVYHQIVIQNKLCRKYNLICYFVCVFLLTCSSNYVGNESIVLKPHLFDSKQLILWYQNQRIILTTLNSVKPKGRLNRETLLIIPLFPQLFKEHDNIYTNVWLYTNSISNNYIKYTIQIKMHILYKNIDQTLLNKLHGPTHCKIGDKCVYTEHVFYTVL